MKISISSIVGQGIIAVVILVTQVLFAHQAEANFWTQRADAVRRMRRDASSPVQGAGLLADIFSTPTAAGLTTQGLIHPASSMTTGSFPEPIHDEAANFLRILLPRATLRSYADAGPGTPLIIHLQDVHGHPGAQRNIARLASDILTCRPGAPLLLEGGAGPIVLPPFGPVSADAVRGTAAFFFNTHLIGGAEVAALTAPAGTRIFGAEDPQLYLANVKAVREAGLLREGLSAHLQSWRDRAEMRADQMFNPALRALNEKSRRWESGAEGLSDRAAFLWERENPRECTELGKFMKATLAEKQMDLAAIQRDRLSLLTALENRVSGSTAATLAQAALAFRSGAIRPGEFYQTLRETVRHCGLVLEHYPAFESYVRYVILADDIHPEKLHHEMETLEASLWNRLTKSEDERRQVALLRDLRLVGGLAKLTLTPDEWARYRDRFADMARLPVRMEENVSPQNWAATLAPFEQFYEFAEARNGALAKNVVAVLPKKSTYLFSTRTCLTEQKGVLLPFVGEGAAERRMRGGFPRKTSPLPFPLPPAGEGNPSRELKSRELKHRPIVVLVAGGFHSAGLAPIFAGQHMSVLTLSPKLDGAGDRTPFDLFTRDRTPLEQIFESPRVTLAETLGIQPIGEEGRGRQEAIQKMGPRLARLLENVNTAPDGLSVDQADPTLVVVSPESQLTDTQVRQLVPGQSVESDVSTSMDEGAESPTVSVFKREKSVVTLIQEWLSSFFPRVRRTSAMILSAAFIGILLMPMVHSPSAHAATFFNNGGSLHVSVEKGDNLWGVAKKVLTAQGGEVTNLRIAQTVRNLAISNNLSNPDKIRAGLSYVVPQQDPKTSQTLTGDPISNGETSNKSDSKRPTIPTHTPVLVKHNRGVLPPPSEGEGWGGGGVTDENGRHPPSALPPQGGKESLKTSLIGFIGVTETLPASTPDPGPKVLPPHNTFSSDFSKQWPVELVLAIGLFLASYFIWWRPKDVDLSAVEKADPRLKEWVEKLDEMNGVTDSHRLESEYLLPLLNNLHALILNHQITPAAVSDRDKVNKQIDTYRSIARLSREVVLLLDRRFQDPQWNGNGAHDRIMEIREIIFLYQLYALKASHALVNASVAHWALSHYDKKTSWFERWKLGALLRTVRGVRTMIGTSVAGFKRNMFNLNFPVGPGIRRRISPFSPLRGRGLFDPSQSGATGAWDPQKVRPMSPHRPHFFRPQKWISFVSVLRANREVQVKDEPGVDSTLWDRAAGLSVTHLGNILVPGLYSEEKKKILEHTLGGLVDKAKTKNLPDISGKDLHRKGLSTMMGLLFWSAAISMTLSVGHATLAFLTGLGVNMLLFRLQSAGTRRDAFYRLGFAEWRELNRNRTHQNGHLNGDGTIPGEDPSHLNRDSIRFNFQTAKEALRTELGAEQPTADMILLVANNEEERAYFEDRRKDVRLFRKDVPVIVLPLPEGQRGSLVAYATAALFPYSDEFKTLAEQTPHLQGRNPWDLRIGTLFSKSPHVPDMASPLSDIPGLPKHFAPETMGETTVFDLALMNVYRATQDRALKALGGMALRWADRAYIGPIRTGEGPGITLDTFWANREEMERFKFGAVVATPGMPMKLIRMNNIENTLHVLTEKHSGRTYDPANTQLDQYQGFSGEGFYALDEAGALALKSFLTSLLKRYGKLKTKPPLNLSTNFLVPAQIAQREPPTTLSQKITTYFAQNGLLNGSSSKERQAFNLKNAKRATAFATGTWKFRLNSNPVEGFFYGGASFSVDPEEARSPSDAKSIELGDKKSIWRKASRAVGSMAVPLAALGSGLSHLGALRGTMAALSAPLLALWLLMSPVGLVASRISNSGTSVVQTYSRNRRERSPQESFSEAKEDVTVDVWSRPEADAAELVAAVTALRASAAPQAESARRALARLALTLIAAAPLQNNLLEGFDVGKTRRIMQRSAPGVWAGDVKEEERLGAGGIIRRTALRSLAHQTAEIHRGTSMGNDRGAALRQAGFLAGMAGLDGQALEDVRALMEMLVGENQMALFTPGYWTRVVEYGRKERHSLVESIKPVVPNQSEESTFTALRVTELLPGASGTAAQRKALIAGIKRRALGNRADRDVLVVNGRVAKDRDAVTVRQSLQKRVKDPGLAPYLATVKIVFVSEDRFTPESVLTRLSPESSRFSMDLVTANPAAILVDLLRPNISYRVILLELIGGELLHVDLMDVARQALQSARVVSAGA